MPEGFTQEFRERVLRAARDRDSTTTVEQIAREFGIHETTIYRWTAKANRAATERGPGDADGTGEPSGEGGEQHMEMRWLRDRNRSLVRENEALRRAIVDLAFANRTAD